MQKIILEFHISMRENEISCLETIEKWKNMKNLDTHLLKTTWIIHHYLISIKSEIECSTLFFEIIFINDFVISSFITTISIIMLNSLVTDGPLNDDSYIEYRMYTFKSCSVNNKKLQSLTSNW